MGLYGLTLWLCLMLLAMQYCKGKESYFYHTFKTKIVFDSYFTIKMFLEPLVALNNHVN